MYIEKIEITNVKTLENFTWELAAEEAKPGWHVFLGDNGSGKSTVLRSCAIALLGPKNAVGLRLPFRDWITQGEIEAKINLTITQDQNFDKWSGQGKTKAGQLKLGVKIDGDDIKAIDRSPSPNRHVWNGAGWFSASFGPYRRFSGGGLEYNRLFYSAPKLAGHLSIFGEEFVLSETLDWLKRLHYEQLDLENRKDKTSKTAKDFFENLKSFINQDNFLPNDAKLHDISPEGVFFKDPAGASVEITSLSDGFRSILSMTLELLRQLSNNYGYGSIFDGKSLRVLPSGVVMIDEIDVHLHPKWQRSIGPWLTKHFPNIQFIVTTHSPLACQGAINGTITKLPSPDQSDVGGRLTGNALTKLLYGDILDAVGSGAFGEGVERSEEGQEMLLELAALNIKSRRQELNRDEASRQAYLLDLFDMKIAIDGAVSA